MPQQQRKPQQRKPASATTDAAVTVSGSPPLDVAATEPAEAAPAVVQDELAQNEPTTDADGDGAGELEHRHAGPAVLTQPVADGKDQAERGLVDEDEPIEPPGPICEPCFPTGWDGVSDDFTAVGCEHGSWSRGETADPVEVEDLAETETTDDSRGIVTVPCRRCYPDGWPAEEPGAFVSCPHGLSIRYGEQVEISRDDAVMMGFIDE